MHRCDCGMLRAYFGGVSVGEFGDNAQQLPSLVFPIRSPQWTAPCLLHMWFSKFSWYDALWPQSQHLNSSVASSWPTKWTRKSFLRLDSTCVTWSSLAPFGLFLGGHRKVATRWKGPFELKRNQQKQLGAYEWAESTVTLLHLILCASAVCLCAYVWCDICGIVPVPGTLS